MTLIVQLILMELDRILSYLLPCFCNVILLFIFFQGSLLSNVTRIYVKGISFISSRFILAILRIILFFASGCTSSQYPCLTSSLHVRCCLELVKSIQVNLRISHALILKIQVSLRLQKPKHQVSMLIFSSFQANLFLRNLEILDLLIDYLRYQKNLDKKTLDNCFGTSLFIISVLESLYFHIHPLFCSSKKLFQYEMYSYFELSAFHEASLFKILNLCLY